MKKVILPLLLLCISISTFSCICEKTCDRTITVHSRDGNDSQLNDVVVYIYDADGKLIGSERTEAGKPINLEPYRRYGHIKIVVWGNALTDEERQKITPPTIGSSIDDHILTQKPSNDTFAGMILTPEPSDIFHGITDYYFSDKEGVDAESANTTVFVDRSVASYALTVRNIGAATEGTEADYQVIVRHPYSGLDAAGNPIGGETIYMPDVTYDPVNDILTTDINRALPTGTKGLIIEIYSGGKLVYSSATDDLGRLITLESNKLHNILLDLNREGYVWLVVTDWDEIVIFEGFS